MAGPIRYIGVGRMKLDTTSGDYDFTYLSLGAGVQSSAMLVLSLITDRVPRPDAVIFADTGDEPYWVYDYLKVLEEFAVRCGASIHTAKHRSGQSISTFNGTPGTRSFVPLYSASKYGGREGMTRRTCTREFKVDPIVQTVRGLLGYKPRQRVRERVRSMLGITVDEAQRMKPSARKWITNTWPLVDLGMQRHHCYEVVDEAGLPPPQKSACVFCPYHSDEYWHWMKRREPEAFRQAVAFDYASRANTKHGLDRPAYVHRSCVPLDEVDFDHQDPNQTDMWAECEGMCGV